MYNEEEVILGQFRENFEPYRKKKMILYGTGINTGRILAAFNDYCIIGIMDVQHTGEIFFDQKVLSEEEVIKMKPDLIVLVCRPIVEQVVYHRIEKLAVKNKIRIFTLDGRLLSDIDKTEPICKQSVLKESEVLDKLKSYSCIIFDLVDVIVLFKPYGEEIGRRTKENNRISLRKKVVSLLEMCIQNGKEVYLYDNSSAEDMDWHSILKEKGLEKIPHILDKFTLREQMVWNNKEYLWIKGKDTQEIQHDKLDIVLLESPIMLMRHSVFGNLVKKADTPLKKLILDFFASECFNDPFVLQEDGKIKITNAEKLGYLFWGPVFMGYLFWLLKEVEREQCDIILFQARDGYLLEKMYQLVKEEYSEVSLPHSIYFLTSRRASIVSGIQTEKDLRIAAGYPFSGNKKEFLKKRFGVMMNEPDPDCETDDYLKCAYKYKKQIYERAQKERQNYRTYLEKNEISKFRKAALMDVTAEGTVQVNLEHFMALPIEGFYFLKKVSEIEEYNRISVKSYYEPKGKYQIRENIYAYFHMMEMLLASQEPSLICFNEKGQPVFAEENRTEDDKEFLLQLQEKVLLYCKEICSLHLNWEEVDWERDFTDELLGYMNHQYIQLSDNRISNLLFEDEFANRMGMACEQL